MSMLRVELGRFRSRRAVRVFAALLLLGVIAGANLTFAHSNRDFAGATARERSHATSEYQACLQSEGKPAPRPAEEPVQGRSKSDAHGDGTCTEPNLSEIHADPRFHVKSLADVLSNLSGSLIIFGLALGATFVGAEWHHRTMTVTLTSEPRRTRVAIAKIAACSVAVFAGALALLALLSGLLVVVAVFRGTTEGASTAWLSHVVSVGSRGAAAAGLAAALGASVAFVARNTAFAMGALFVWMSVIEGFASHLRPGSRAWLIRENAAAFVAQSADSVRSGLASGLLLAVYGALFVCMAVVTFRRRDVA